ncbi:unnamed protein product, partial [Symbiodinium necroappetens]
AVIPTPSASSTSPAEAFRPQTESAEHADRDAEEAPQESPAVEPPTAAASQEAGENTSSMVAHECPEFLADNNAVANAGSGGFQASDEPMARRPENLEKKADPAEEEAVIATPSASSTSPAEASRPQTESAEHADRDAEEATPH